MPETRTVKDFAEVGLPLAEGDFECCTFDHSDNSPYLFSSVLSSKKLLENSLGRKQERKQKIFDFEIFCVEEHQGEAGGRKSQVPPKFRVSPVMTTSIPLRMKRNAVQTGRLSPKLGSWLQAHGYYTKSAGICQ